MSAIVPRLVIDKSSPVPLYFQLARQLEQLINAGDLVPGTRLENEVALADQLGVSRPTVRNAIQYLVDGGLVSRQRGIGTQVLSPRVRRRETFTSLFDELQSSGQRPRTDVLSLRVEAAAEPIAHLLELEPGGEVYAIERLRYADDEPLALMRNWLPAQLLELTEVQLVTGGLYAALRAANISPKVAHQVIGARTATAAESRVLHDKRDAPLLTIERTAWDDKGRSIEYGSHVYRARRYSFEFTLSATSGWAQSDSRAALSDSPSRAAS